MDVVRVLFKEIIKEILNIKFCIVVSEARLYLVVVNMCLLVCADQTGDRLDPEVLKC